MAPLPALALLLALARPGSPQAPPSPDEQRLFDEGLRAYQAGDARAAEKAWKAGYAIAHDPAFLVRIGEAEEKAGASAEAAETYRHYLREAPDASDRADIEQRLSRLGPPPAAPAAPEGNETPGEMGAHPGAAAPAVPTAPAPRVPPAPHVGATDAEPTPNPGESEDSGWNRYNITAWIATAATAALLGTSGFLAASAASKKDDVNRLVTFRNEFTEAPLEYGSVASQYQSAFDDGRSLDRAAKATLFAAIGTAVVATTFFLIDGFRTPEAGVALRGPGLGTGSLTWRF